MTYAELHQAVIDNVGFVDGVGDLLIDLGGTFYPISGVTFMADGAVLSSDGLETQHD